MISILLGFFILTLVARGYLNIYTHSKALKSSIQNYEGSMNVLQKSLNQLETYNFQKEIQKGDSVLDNNPLSSIAIAATEDSNTVSSPAIEIVGSLNVNNSSLFGFVLFITSVVVIYGIQHGWYYRIFFPQIFVDNCTINDVFDEKTKKMCSYLEDITALLGRVKDSLIEMNSHLWFAEDVMEGPPHVRLERHIDFLSSFKELYMKTGSYGYDLDHQLITMVSETREILSRILFELYLIEDRISEMDVIFKIVQEAEADIVIITVITGIGF
jgi:hypothetical protein